MIDQTISTLRIEKRTLTLLAFCLLFAAVPLGCDNSAHSDAVMVGRKYQEQAHLREVILAVHRYAEDNDQLLPEHVADASGYHESGSAQQYFVIENDAPGSVSMDRSPGTPYGPYTYGSFTFLPVPTNRVNRIQEPQLIPIGFSAKPREGVDGDCRAVGFLDTHIEIVTEAQFQEQLPQWEAFADQYVQQRVERASQE